MKQRFVTEMGMGTDVHGGDSTKAAERAVNDAIHHSSLHFFKPLQKTAHDMFIDLHIGVPNPDSVDRDRVANALPYGTVNLTVVDGGLTIPGENGDHIIVANAGIIVHLET